MKLYVTPLTLFVILYIIFIHYFVPSMRSWDRHGRRTWFHIYNIYETVMVQRSVFLSNWTLRGAFLRTDLVIYCYQGYENLGRLSKAHIISAHDKYRADQGCFPWCFPTTGIIAVRVTTKGGDATQPYYIYFRHLPRCVTPKLTHFMLDAIA